MRLIVIPARYGSTRFPGKPLHPIAGKPLVQHVWEQCRKSQLADRVVVATDDDRILKACASFGAEAVMTSPDHVSGTDRIAEVAKQFPEAELILNVQGDEPLISASLIDALFQALLDDGRLDMVTAAKPLADGPLVDDPSIVKCVTTLTGRALYFSRSRIPFVRNADDRLRYLWHKGIYGYRRSFLLDFVAWPPSMLEMTESLEQLRALENGASIHVFETEEDSPGVDTPEQALAVERLLLRN